MNITTITLRIQVKDATKEQINAFVDAALVQAEDLHDVDGNPLGDLPIVGDPEVLISGRADVIRAAKYKGFAVWASGGGCEALRCDLPNGRHILITNMDAQVPEYLEERVAIGLYANDDDSAPLMYEEATGIVAALAAADDMRRVAK